MLLFKQARAFGVGVLLATQNPVDLDYKALSNAGTWFVGRLQTPQDIDRLVKGMGAGAGESEEDLSKTISALGKRVFLMKNIHENALEIFQTRWCLSYLARPADAGSDQNADCRQGDGTQGLCSVRANAGRSGLQFRDCGATKPAAANSRILFAIARRKAGGRANLCTSP